MTVISSLIWVCPTRFPVATAVTRPCLSRSKGVGCQHARFALSFVVRSRCECHMGSQGHQITNGNLIKDRQQWQTNNGYCGEIPDPCNPRRCVSPPRDTTAAPFCVYSVSCEEVAGRCALAGVGSTDLNRLPQYSVSTAFYSRRKRPVFAHDARSAKRPSRENLDRRAVSVSKLEVERDRFHVCGGVCTEHAGLGFRC